MLIQMDLGKRTISDCSDLIPILSILYLHATLNRRNSNTDVELSFVIGARVGTMETCNQ